MKGHLVALACSKSGSRALDGLWNQGSIRARETIASELVSKEAQLTSNPFGKFIARKAALAVFKRSKDQWKNVIGQQDKKRKVAQDFLSDFDGRNKSKTLISANVQESPMKKMKFETEEEVKVENGTGNEKDFVIDRVGDESLKVEPTEEIVEKKKKEKKKKAKSYLDDL